MPRFNPSRPHQGPTRPWPLIAGLCCVLSLPACAALPSAPTIHVPQALREPCRGPTTPLRTQADDDTYKVRMEAALAGCSSRGDTLVQIIDGAQPKKRKRFGLF